MGIFPELSEESDVVSKNYEITTKEATFDCVIDKYKELILSATYLDYSPTYLNKLNQGEDSFIVSNLFYDSIKVMTDSSNRNTTSELIEYDNYIRSLLYSEIGLFSNFNMKKERLITDELKADDPICLHNQDIFFSSIKEGVLKINELYKRDIKCFKNKVLAM